MTATEKFYGKVNAMKAAEFNGDFQRAFDVARVRHADLYKAMFAAPISAANARRAETTSSKRRLADTQAKLRQIADRFGWNLATHDGFQKTFAFYAANENPFTGQPASTGSLDGERAKVRKLRAEASQQMLDLAKRRAAEMNEDFDAAWEQVQRSNPDLWQKANTPLPDSDL